jgi:hypothetical protein
LSLLISPGQLGQIRFYHLLLVLLLDIVILKRTHHDFVDVVRFEGRHTELNGVQIFGDVWRQFVHGPAVIPAGLQPSGLSVFAKPCVLGRRITRVGRHFLVDLFGLAKHVLFFQLPLKIADLLFIGLLPHIEEIRKLIKRDVPEPLRV